MEKIKKVDGIKRNKTNLKWVDWLFIVLGLASIIGAAVTFAERQNFVYFCFAVIIKIECRYLKTTNLCFVINKHNIERNF